jgi:UDP-N-acetylglucosamine 4,6-dehydratase/5-epimerase
MKWPQTRVLVTGGTGSFGNFIVRRLLDLGAQEVRVLSRDEKKQYDMRVFYEDRPDLSLVIGDIRQPRAVDEAMEGIDVVFQAAALKQVPTCESFPVEAIATNVLGVENVIRSALTHRVKRFVSISTDKAVKPVNVMGMTKALQERLVLQANRSRSNAGTVFSCVRYGNVLRSRGSVVPFFRQQLALGKRLTITDERMTRFLLTLNDAIDLVLHAAERAIGGEIFVRKAPAARVVDIAQVLAQEAGKPFEYDIIGTYPGEKLAEILVSEEELERTEDPEDNYITVHPWWTRKRPQALTHEYSSSDEVVDLDGVRTMIAKADEEFSTLEVPEGEFSRF